MRLLRVAAVQMECILGNTQANLMKAATLVEQAAAHGAALVLLPELMPGGYRMTEEIWTTAESATGPTVSWLCSTAHRLSIHLGCSLLEADGDDFYNSFFLATPEGRIAGRVRKSPPASVEAYFYRAGSDRHVIETTIGRIGIGICYENLLCRQLCEMFDEKVDLVLQPTSAATPSITFPLRPSDAKAFERMVADGPAIHARKLGVPVLMANKCGRFISPLPGPFPEQDTRFPGLSRIVDGAGEIMAAMADEEGVIVADITLDPRNKAVTRPQTHGHWSMNVPWVAVLWRMSQKLGEWSYRRNPRRAAAARAIQEATRLVFLSQGK